MIQLELATNKAINIAYFKDLILRGIEIEDKHKDYVYLKTEEFGQVLTDLDLAELITQAYKEIN